MNRIFLIIITVALWIPPTATGFFMGNIGSFVGGLIVFSVVGLASALLSATVWDWIPHDWFMDIENGG